MSDRDINEILKELNKEQKKEIQKESWDYAEPDKRNYQPTKYELDDDNPPDDDE